MKYALEGKLKHINVKYHQCHIILSVIHVCVGNPGHYWSCLNMTCRQWNLSRNILPKSLCLDKYIFPTLQYIPRNMHTVFALLCFVVVIHWLIFPYPSGLLHWHCGNLTIAPVPAKQPWWIWINTSCEFIMNDCITTTKQSTTKPCAYFLGCTVSYACLPQSWPMQMCVSNSDRQLHNMPITNDNKIVYCECIEVRDDWYSYTYKFIHIKQGMFMLANVLNPVTPLSPVA